MVHTFNSFLDPTFVSPRKGAYTLLDSVRAIDDRTVEFKLKQPFGSFPINLVMPIVPASAGPDFRDHPIGTGPYRFVSHAADDRLVLERFPTYFRGAPRNAGVIFKVVPDDIMRGLELRKGTVDIVVNELAPDVVWQFEQQREFQLVKSPGTDYTYMGINLRDPILKDVRVRHAISCDRSRRDCRISPAGSRPRRGSSACLGLSRTSGLSIILAGDGPAGRPAIPIRWIGAEPRLRVAMQGRTPSSTGCSHP